MVAGIGAKVGIGVGVMMIITMKITFLSPNLHKCLGKLLF